MADPSTSPRPDFDPDERWAGMSREGAFIGALKSFASSAASRYLDDDVAVLKLDGTNLILTKDMIAEGVHYRRDDPPVDVAWKLVGVNLSDLAAKGARPIGALLGFTLGEEAWDLAFAQGLREACETYAVPLLGGDTIALPAGAPRVLSMTLLGTAETPGPARSWSGGWEELWVSGTVGDAGAGLAMLDGALAPDPALIARYRRPTPRLALGEALAPHVSAIMDVSDGLLIDAARLCRASRRAITIALDEIPLSDGFRAAVGEDREARMKAATVGDDYELLFLAPPPKADAIRAAAVATATPVTRIGKVGIGAGLSISERGVWISMPERLGYEHGTG